MKIDLGNKLAVARAMFDQGHNKLLVARLPELLALAEESLNTGNDDFVAQYCLANNLATDVLDKLGLVNEARITAENSIRISRQTDSPLFMAAADRGLSIVLRHEGQLSAAQEVSQHAANVINTHDLASYIQVMCTHAYVAAHNGDRDSALAAMTEAEQATLFLAPSLIAAQAMARVRAYQVSTHWALGDPDSAIEAGNKVNVLALPTAERKARFHTDMARAQWMRENPDETALALLAAWSYAPEEIKIRKRVFELAQKLMQTHAKLHSVGLLADKII